MRKQPRLDIEFFTTGQLLGELIRRENISIVMAYRSNQDHERESGVIFSKTMDVFEAHNLLSLAANHLAQED